MDEMKLNAPAGSNKKKKIKGRGRGSGKGNRCGRGDKGQNARSGGGVRVGFEGGQMPLYRRIARRGFSNYPFKTEYKPINLELINSKYSAGETVSVQSLAEKKIIGKKVKLIKILARGELDKKLTFELAHISKNAREKIEKAGGTIVSADSAADSSGAAVSAEAADTSGEKRQNQAEINGE